MNTATKCPETTELTQLIGGTLSSDRQEACIRHLDACSCCQVKLEELAVEGTNLSRVVER